MTTSQPFNSQDKFVNVYEQNKKRAFSEDFRWRKTALEGLEYYGLERFLRANRVNEMKQYYQGYEHTPFVLHLNVTTCASYQIFNPMNTS